MISLENFCEINAHKPFSTMTEDEQAEWVREYDEAMKEKREEDRYDERRGL